MGEFIFYFLIGVTTVIVSVHVSLYYVKDYLDKETWRDVVKFNTMHDMHHQIHGIFNANKGMPDEEYSLDEQGEKV